MLVEFVGDVEGVHDFLADALGVVVEDSHNGVNAVVERGMRWIGHEFVILDEIDPGFGEGFNDVGGLLGRHADAGFNDGADEGKVLDAGELAATGDAEGGPAEMFGRRRGEVGGP